VITIESLVGKDTAEAFVNAMKTPSTGDLLGMVLQFIIQLSL
jgi:hypothetical protein